MLFRREKKRQHAAGRFFTWSNVPLPSAPTSGGHTGIAGRGETVPTASLRTRTGRLPTFCDLGIAGHVDVTERPRAPRRSQDPMAASFARPGISRPVPRSTVCWTFTEHLGKAVKGVTAQRGFDGYDQRYLTGKAGASRYVDDGQVVLPRYDDWKVIVPREPWSGVRRVASRSLSCAYRCCSTCADPFERAQHNSTYNDWFLVARKFIAARSRPRRGSSWTMKVYPPSQTPGLFNLTKIEEQLKQLPPGIDHCLSRIKGGVSRLQG